MPPTGPIDAILTARLAHVVERHGGRKVAGLIGVSVQTVFRALKGHGVYCGNRALIELKLADIEALQVKRKASKG